MNFLMVASAGPALALESAERAPETLCIGVGEHVGLQVSFLGAAVGAQRAREGLLGGVGHEVSLHVGHLVAGVGAEGAQEAAQGVLARAGAGEGPWQRRLLSRWKEGVHPEGRW